MIQTSTRPARRQASRARAKLAAPAQYTAPNPQGNRKTRRHIAKILRTK